MKANKKSLVMMLGLVLMLFVVFGMDLIKDSKPPLIEEDYPRYEGSSQQSEGLQFKTKDRFEEHYEKHVINQKEFGDITKEEYLELANQLMSTPGDSVLIKEEGGDTLYYDEATNSFGVKSEQGFIRTFFKPSDGIEYFERQ